MKLIELIKSKKEWLKTTAENLSAFQAGAALAFTSNFFSKMTMDCFYDNDLKQRLTDFECYVIFVLLPLGAILGTLLGAFLLYIIGRLKSILLLAVLPFFVVYTVTIFQHNLMIIYLGRLFLGIGVGSTYLLLPIYNAETCTGYSPKEVYITFFAYHAGGVCFSFYVNGYALTRTFCIVSAIVGFISFLLTFFYLRESPYDLVKRGKFTEAESVLMRMQERPLSEIDKELNAMEALADQREATTYNDLQKQKWDVNALAISAILLALPHFSGVMGFFAFGELFLNELEADPFSHRSPTDAVVFAGFIHFGVSLLVFRVLTKAGRRNILRNSTILITIGLIVISFFYFDDLLEYHIPMHASWLPPVAFAWLLGWYSMGCSVFPWIIMMELFSPVLIHNALVVVCVYFWFLYIIIGTLTFILINYHFMLGMLFVVFAVCCGFEAYFVHFHLIETNNKTYDEIKAMLNK